MDGALVRLPRRDRAAGSERLAHQAHDRSVRPAGLCRGGRLSHRRGRYTAVRGDGDGRAPHAAQGRQGDVAEPWRISARVKANAATALFEQVEYQYGPDDRALKLAGTAEAKFGARPRLDAVLSARTLDADKLFGGAARSDIGRRARRLRRWSRRRSGSLGRRSRPRSASASMRSTLGGTSLQNIRGDIEFGRGTMTLTAFEARGAGLHAIAGERTPRQDRATACPSPVRSMSLRAIRAPSPTGSTASRAQARCRRARSGFAARSTLGADRIAIARMQAEFDRKAFDGDLAYRFATVRRSPRDWPRLYAPTISISMR